MIKKFLKTVTLLNLVNCCCIFQSPRQIGSPLLAERTKFVLRYFGNHLSNNEKGVIEKLEIAEIKMMRTRLRACFQSNIVNENQFIDHSYYFFR